MPSWHCAAVIDDWYKYLNSIEETSIMYYHAEEMDGFSRIGSAEGVFCYLIIGTERALLIDTGYCFSDLRSAVRAETDKPLVIVNTHGHCDHAGGNAQFSETCYLHRADWELCQAHTSPQMRKDNAKRAECMMDYQANREINALPNTFDLDAYCAMGTGFLAEIKEGDRFDLGGATLIAYETPGHTHGCVSLLYEEKNIVFTGDAANAFTWLFASESTDRGTYIRSLQKLRGLQADAYWGGHSPLPAHLDDIDRYIQVAQEADYEKGIPIDVFLEPECQPRMCILDGCSEKSILEPGFASIIISADK